MAMGISLGRLLSSDKIVPIYRQRASARKFELGPLAVELHWTSDCNYDCVHCSYGSRRQNRNRLNDEVIRVLIKDMIELKAEAVYLSGGGEPLLVKGWQQVADELMTSGVDVALITNGVGITNESLSIIRRMNYVAVSIYSTESGEYEKITGSKHFEKQFNLPARIKHEQGRVIVGARCVINNINYRSVADIYISAMSSGYDYLIFIPVVDYEGVGLSLKFEELSLLGELIRDKRDLFDRDRTNLLEVLDRKIAHYDKSDYREKFANTIELCSAVDIRGNAYINYDGGVWLCQPHIGNMRYCIGNLNENRLINIWNSSRHIDVINLLHREFTSGNCRNCRSIAFNVNVDRYLSGAASLDNISYDPFI